MKRMTYTVLTAAYLVFLHGAIHSAEVALRIEQLRERSLGITGSNLEGVPAEQPSGEIQERAVKLSGPIIKVPQELLPVQPAMTLLLANSRYAPALLLLSHRRGGRWPNHRYLPY